MEKRKNPEKDLRNKSGLFFQIGLLSAMFLTVCAFEFRSREVLRPVELPTAWADMETIPPITDIKPPSPPPKPVVHNPVELEPDEIEIELPDLSIDTEEMPDLVIEVVEVEVPEEKAPELPFDIVEEMPEPAGGYEAFYQFVNKKLRYPAQARRMGIEGVVYLSFVVNEKGEMTNLTIAKGIGAGCDAEVLRIFKDPPKWNPGKQRGIPVKVNKIMPIKFVLN